MTMRITYLEKAFRNLKNSKKNVLVHVLESEMHVDVWRRTTGTGSVQGHVEVDRGNQRESMVK